MLHPVKSKKISLWKKNYNEIVMKSELNICAMMAYLYCGTVDADITKNCAFLDLSGTKLLGQTSLNHSEKVSNQITLVVNTVIQESL